MIEFLVITMLVTCSIVNSISIYKLSQRCYDENATILNKLSAIRDGMIGFEYQLERLKMTKSQKKDPNKAKLVHPKVLKAMN